jgi:hypothetical protein
MRLLLAFWLTVFVASEVRSQGPYPTTAEGQPVWGGYAVGEQVPYQPTLDGQPAAIVPAEPNPVWQTYPSTNIDASGAVMLDNVGPPGTPVALPGDAIYATPAEPSLRDSLTPPDARNGFFQKARFTVTEVPQFDYTNLGWTDLRTEIVTALPFFTRENPIIITPSYELHILDRPLGFDLPPRLNDAAIDFHIFRVFDNHWIADFAVTPGLFADDHSFDSSDALRVNGRAVGVYAPTIDLKYVLGVTYVDGGWSKVVPVAGVIYKPNDDVEYQIIFPTPRVAWRLPWSPVPGRDERWMYVAVEYANSAWAIEQTNGTPDVLSYRDYRIILGVERKICGGISHRLDVGYVFNRDMKIASVGGEDISMDDSLLVRAGISY